jgi:hypothetical protein
MPASRYSCRHDYQLVCMAKKRSNPFSKIITFPDGAEANIIEIADEFDNLRELATGDSGEEGVRVFRCLYRACHGESLPAAERELLQKWGDLQEDGMVSALKRAVLLSAFRIEPDGSVVVGSPFTDPQDRKVAERFLALVETYLGFTWVQELLAEKEGVQLSKEYKDRAVAQALEQIFPRRDNKAWADIIKDRDKGEPGAAKDDR